MAHRIGQGVTAGGPRRWRRAAQWTAGAAAVALLTAACGGSSSGKSAGAPVGDGQTASSGTSGGASGGANSGTNAGAPSTPAPQPVTLSTSPADGAAGVDPAKGIQINAVNGKLESVTATDAAGKAVTGALAADGSS